MKLIASKSTLADGKKIINAYKITLTKSEVEKAGFKAGDEFKAEYTKEEIVLKKQ